ncbi:MAG: hypothetical protein FIA97_12800, partial [Methylococcaceae bacterium]|nr:hypothetical protein [Methylococcaceae bacterium]
DKSLPLTFSLSGQPEGMTIDSATGQISWTAAAASSQAVNFTVTASDSEGGHGFQRVTVNVCVLPQHWHSDHGMCM